MLHWLFKFAFPIIYTYKQILTVASYSKSTNTSYVNIYKASYCFLYFLSGYTTHFSRTAVKMKNEKMQWSWSNWADTTRKHQNLKLWQHLLRSTLIYLMWHPVYLSISSNSRYGFQIREVSLILWQAQKVTPDNISWKQQFQAWKLCSSEDKQTRTSRSFLYCEARKFCGF